jgi:hypothetical protein
MKRLKIERLLDAISDDSLREVLSYLPFRYLYLAPVSKRFYRLRGKCETEVDAIVETISSLQWARIDISEHRSRPCDIAARRGRLDVLQFAHSRVNSIGICEYAALGGHLNMLQWLRSHQCPWNKTTFSAAAKRGHPK